MGFASLYPPYGADKSICLLLDIYLRVWNSTVKTFPRLLIFH